MDKSNSSIYIAGPMTGKPGHNFAAFDAAEKKLRAEGWREVINPAQMSRTFRQDHNITMERLAGDGALMKRLLKMELASVAMVDALYLLDGWEYSVGARREYNTFISSRIDEDDEVYYESEVC